MNSLHTAVLVASTLLLSFTGTAAATGSAKPDQSWRFKVLLDDSPIGYHRVDVDREQSRKIVHTRANFDVRFLMIPVYSYEHETTERWEDGCLVEITSSTDDNGDDFFVRSDRSDDELALQTQDGSNRLEGCVRTFAYWDVELLQSARLLNTQTGEYLPVRFEELGSKTISNGKAELQARHFRLVAEERVIDLWYTDDMHWLALESVTESGRVLRYLPEDFSTFNPVNPS